MYICMALMGSLKLLRLVSANGVDANGITAVVANQRRQH